MKKIPLLFSGIFLTAFLLEAQTSIDDGTEVSGTWTKINSPYYINGLATVPHGDTLIIEPGVEVMFKAGNDFNYSGDSSVNVGHLYIKGQLIAEGTSTQKITFTRQGDSGNWGCIFISNADANSTLEYCVIQYANRIDNYRGAVNIYTPKTKLLNSSVINNLYCGISTEWIYNDISTQGGSTPDIQNCIIANNMSTGIYLGYEYNSKTDTVKLLNNSIIGNKSVGVSTFGTKCQVINCIFWGNAKSFSITNDYTLVSYSLVQEDVLPAGWLKTGEGVIYNVDPQLNSDLSLPNYSRCINTGIPDISGLMLPETDIAGNTRINLGRIDMGALESPSERFICITEPVGHEGFFPGTSQEIKWRSNAADVKLEYTSNDGETWEDIVASTTNDGLYNWIIPPVESESFNIRISDVTDNSVFDVCDDNFVVFTSNIPDSTTLAGRLTIEHSPYYINGLATVPLGESLIIDPGVEIRFKTNESSSKPGLLTIKGNLTATGTSNQRITFTRQDDSGNWGFISFATTADTSSALKYCKIEFAGSTVGAVTIRNRKVSISYSEIITNNSSGIYCDHSSPSIQNCVIAKNGQYGIYIYYSFNVNADYIFITNNTITGNGSPGLYNYYAKCKIVNNIFWNNKESFKIYYTSLASYNLVQEDVVTASSLKTGEGMIYNLNPQFINSDSNDYHLKVTSPCIDAGDPGDNFDMEPSDNGGRINIGAYGNTDEAASTQYLPRIDYLSARNGSIFGKDTLIIKGANFLETKQNGKIHFEDTEAIKYLFWNDDSLVCITPLHLPETVSIYITNNDLKEGYGSRCYSFKSPVIKNLNRVTGKIPGGDTLMIEGEYFGIVQDPAIMLLEEQPVDSYLIWTDTLIVVITPENIPGLKQIIFKQDTFKFYSGASFIYAPDTGIELCGELEDTLKADQIYILKCSCEVPPGKTLTIEPGVIVIADYNQAEKVRLTVNGTLNATGTSSGIIRFMTMIPGKNNWDGIYIADTANFNFVVVQNSEQGIYQTDGFTSITNSQFKDNETGVHYYGKDKKISSILNNCIISGNMAGLMAEGSGNYSQGLASVEVISSFITGNSGYGVELYGHGYITSGSVPATTSSNVIFTLKNSIISHNQGHAIFLHSLGFTSMAIPKYATRTGSASLKSYNNIIFSNNGGIVSERGNKNAQTRIKAEFYNTNIWNNSTIFEMDANQVFFYNSNLWDNNISGVPTGLCDSLIFESCNLNDLSVVQNGNNNISTDPLYAMPDTGNFMLENESPCIDAGSNEFVYSETDFDGKVRIWNATDKDNAIVDIGAYEFGTPCYATIIEKNICEGESYEGHTESGIIHNNYSSVSGCDSVILINLHVNPVPEKPTIIHFLNILTSDVASGNQWYLNDTAIADANGQNYIATTSGDYHVVITNEFGCVSSPSNIITLINTLLDKLEEYRLEVYPNPASDYINVEGLPGNEAVEIAIYNLNGNLVKKMITTSKTVQINIKDLEPAAYFLILNNQTNQVIKIIKN